MKRAFVVTLDVDDASDVDQLGEVIHATLESTGLIVESVNPWDAPLSKPLPPLAQAVASLQ